MSLEAAIQSLADAIRDHAAALRGQGVLFPPPMVGRTVETPVSGDTVAAIIEQQRTLDDYVQQARDAEAEGPVQPAGEIVKRGRGRPPKNAPPLAPIAETMPVDAEDLQRTLDDHIQQSRDAEAEGPVQPEPEPAPIGAESEPAPPVAAPTAEPITRDKLRDYLMTVARPIPTIGTAGCQRLIQEHGGVAKLSDVPEDKLRAVYTAAVAAVEAASDDLG